jgi:hypothetical protein
MTRSEMTAVFLASLDELAAEPTYNGGTPERPSLDCDTVLTVFLEQVHNWSDIPYPAIRAMFAALLEHLPMDEAERLCAVAGDELEVIERCRAEQEAERQAKRAAETATMLDNLETLRTESPEKYQQAMGMLAKALAKVASEGPSLAMS